MLKLRRDRSASATLQRFNASTLTLPATVSPGLCVFRSASMNMKLIWRRRPKQRRALRSLAHFA